MIKIKVETTINADIEAVWEHYSNPKSIKGWAFASDDWECPYAENDLRVDGRFLTRMKAKDGSKDNGVTFDFTGTYIDVVELEKINYLMDKAENEERRRECEVVFKNLGEGKTFVSVEFDPENENSEDLQRSGWQAILDNFKKFVESQI